MLRKSRLRAVVCGKQVIVHHSNGNMLRAFEDGSKTFSVLPQRRLCRKSCFEPYQYVRYNFHAERNKKNESCVALCTFINGSLSRVDKIVLYNESRSVILYGQDEGSQFLDKRIYFV